MGVKWLARRTSVVFYEFSSFAGETPDVIGWSSYASTLIECKSSRSDFKADAKKFSRRFPNAGMGQFRWYLCPEGVIPLASIPDRWGLLYVKGRHVVVIREAQGFPQRNHASEITFLTSMLRRAQIRIGNRPLSEWLRKENQFEAKRGITPNASSAQ